METLGRAFIGENWQVFCIYGKKYELFSNEDIFKGHELEGFELILWKPIDRSLIRMQTLFIRVWNLF